MRVLVTGGSGLVGRYVVDALALTHTVEVLDLKPLHRPDIRLHQVDMLELRTLASVVKEFDVVVHLAGIPHPLNEPAEKVFRVNTLGVFNMLEASAASGVKQFIFLSSESTLGFAFSTTRVWPHSIPIDEAHPLNPQDAYGLSKVAGELLCAGATRKTALQTICLRAPWIWVPEEQHFYRQLIAEYGTWYKNLWAYIHVNDVAQAIQSVIVGGSSDLRLPSHDVFFICAEQNWTGKDSRSLLREFYPETKAIASDFHGDQSLISNAKAKRAFGFIPRYSVKDIIREENAKTGSH